ncbi:Bifunctional lycopene cyclase/phytoene synthase [Lachnellula subtilissima]|uniref:Bifunctional lycopene cyclase/phytoene synthase n=1 Tax=Lachnellula subtilissima TaxID=602034 RepID=A0A8H8RV51_9HELO|nr:Bifunctional lycopene cyclase/phytoene synthase [Lachnellula subtilissima]
MGFEYALVHLKYTIPPAIALTYIYRPFFSRLDLYKVFFLITIAVVSTIPWDSYLIRRKIWTYPPSVIIGPRLFSIPAEELFFFVIQTYNTSLVYFFLSKPLLHSKYLVARNTTGLWQRAGQATLAAWIVIGGFQIRRGGEGTYLGLIVTWAAPFLLLLWSLSSQFLLNLPYSSTVVPIAIPTIYLWIVDTLALKRGTWAISSGTKVGVQLWHGLEIEEAIFFLATNTLIVFGLVAFDHAVAILLTFPDLFPKVPELPSPVMLIQALLTDPAVYDGERVEGLREAVARLQKKSRSFYLASSTFSGRLRIDLILLYSFCRVADDLVDNADTKSTAREWIRKLTHYLDLAYASKEARVISKEPSLNTYITSTFPTSAHSALRLLPTYILPYKPLYDLLEGFKTDLEFTPTISPIQTEHDLENYAAYVAGTVAELILELVFVHTASPTSTSTKQRDHLIRSGARMGIALQYVNIARDISVDAGLGRVYIPYSWLSAEGLTTQDVLDKPELFEVARLRNRLLAKAFGIYGECGPAMRGLPRDARAPMRVAVESYMEIGRVLKKRKYRVVQGRATVPVGRRALVAWRALSEG